MDTEERLMLAIGGVSFVAAIFITRRVWPGIERRLARSRAGRLVLSSGRTGRKPVFLVHVLIWMALYGAMLLLWALVTSNF